MTQDNNKQRSWLVRVHQKINDGMVDSNPRLDWVRSKFGTAITTLLFATFACNWYVIYGTSVEEMPGWLTSLSQWVVNTIPGAKSSVQYSWFLRDVFPYIYTVNLLLGSLVFIATLVTASYTDKLPLLKVVGIKDILKLHCTYLFLGMLCSFLIVGFYFGLTLEPVLEAKALPKTSAAGGSLLYRAFETKFGALLIYSGTFSFTMPFVSAICLHLSVRWYLSAYMVFYTYLFKKEAQ